MRAVRAGEWKTYQVVIKRVHSGELKDYLVEGMEFDYNGAKLRINNQEIPAPHIRGMIRKGWVVPVEDVAVPEPPPVRQSSVERSIAAKKKSTRVLPEGWANEHWTRKIKYIESCENAEILENIRRSESRSVKAAAEERLTFLEERESAVPKRGPAPYLDAETDQELARATGSEIALQGKQDDG